MTEPVAAQGGPPRRRPRPAPVHTVGVGLAIVAAVLLLLACTALNWFDDSIIQSIGNRGTSLRDVHAYQTLADQSGVFHARVVSDAFFTWAAWLLLAVAVGAAVLGNLAAALGQRGRGPGLIALVAGLVGAAITFAAIDLFGSTGKAGVPTYGEWLRHVGPAFFCAVAGFLLVAFAGAAAARRPLTTADPATAQVDSAAS